MPVDPAKLRIVHYPNPVLRERARELPTVTPEVQAVARRMVEIMHELRGVGLAAPQVGLAWRLFVANPGEREDAGDAAPGDRVYINPVLTNPSRDTASREEGCLSIPGVNGDITRPAAITIRALDVNGQPFEETADGLLARIWQHETDHLDGMLIIDRMPPVDRRANVRALRDLESKVAR